MDNVTQMSVFRNIPHCTHNGGIEPGPSPKRENGLTTVLVHCTSLIKKFLMALTRICQKYLVKDPLKEQS